MKRILDKLSTTAMAYGLVIFGLLGCFFLCLNPAEEGTSAAQFWMGLILSKALMAGCWMVAVRIYRRLYDI